MTSRNDFLKLATENQDAARRISDSVSLHIIAATDVYEIVGQWCAFSLQDGRSDNTLYPSKDDAIRHQKGNPKNYCYLKITPDGIRPKDAWSFLRTNRHPMIDTTAPEYVHNPQIYPHMSNMSPLERARLKLHVEREAKNRAQ
jgi:hypothetical protein